MTSCTPSSCRKHTKWRTPNIASYKYPLCIKVPYYRSKNDEVYSGSLCHRNKNGSFGIIFWKHVFDQKCYNLLKMFSQKVGTFCEATRSLLAMGTAILNRKPLHCHINFLLDFVCWGRSIKVMWPVISDECQFMYHFSWVLIAGCF